MRGGALLAALLFAVLSINRSDAHRAHVTLTSITRNPTTGNLEIVHAVHYHDALRLLAVRGRDSIQPSSIEGRARIALEVERGFRWCGPDGGLLQPKTVGAELDGDNVVVYQEISAPIARGRHAIEANLMHDVFADQLNNVVVEFSKPYSTLRLSRGKNRGEFDIP